MIRRLMWKDHMVAPDMEIVSCSVHPHPEWGFIDGPPLAPPHHRTLMALDGSQEYFLKIGLMTLIPKNVAVQTFATLSESTRMSAVLGTHVTSDDSDEEDSDEEDGGGGMDIPERSGVEEGEVPPLSPVERPRKRPHIEAMEYIDYGDIDFKGIVGGRSVDITVRSYRAVRGALVDERLEFWARTREDIKDFVRTVWRRVLVEKRDKVVAVGAGSLQRVALWEPTRKRDDGLAWTRQSRLHARPPHTLVLRNDDLECILEDARRFLAPETREAYARVATPYRRGYLLHGPPGTGKTSLVHCVATSLGIDVFSMSFGTMDGDEFAHLMKGSYRRIIMIEDVDAAFHENRRTNEASFPFSVFLNQLSSVSADDGVLVFMTTNHRDRLDPALIRPGRIDYELGMNNVDPDQAVRLVRLFCGEPQPALEEKLRAWVERWPIAPAMLQRTLFMRGDMDINRIESELRECVEGTRRTHAAHMYN